MIMINLSLNILYTLDAETLEPFGLGTLYRTPWT